ncbi:MAG: FAD-dependent oxidoreductase [Clostridiaceae bacterium]|nr:FAD-dependent oxidoreductase [Clostridiaceae bacterium]
MSHYDSNPEHVRQPIIELGQKITDRVGVKVGPQDPEYYGLAAMITDEMAEIALTMDLRSPYTIDEMMEKTEYKYEKEELEQILFEMGYAGVLEFWYTKDEKKDRLYVLPVFVMGSAEFSNMRMKDLEEKPQMAAFFERMTFLPLEKITPMVPPGGAGIGMHVVPVEKAIPSNARSESIEHISHWLDKYDGRYAASPCSCRYGRKILGEGCADDPEDWCIAMGDMADYIVETDRGRYASREEVLEILERAEENGFVHQITNMDGEDKIIAICNCNVDICNALRTSQLFNTPNMSRSAYVAKVQREECVACGKCVEVCPAGAVKLGQKLCTSQGEVKYPIHILPDNNKWGPEMWDPDYRDNNQINCYDTGTAPCKSACPAHIAVQGYLKLAAQGKYTEALALIKQDNPLPAICGHICNRPCEDVCTRSNVDQAVAIDAVKKFIAEQDLNAETRYVPKKIIPSNRGGFKQKIAIIGAGPAGLSCAYYLALRGYSPTIFEKNEKPGGMLVYGIPSYKLQDEVIQAEIEIIEELGVEIKCGVEVGKDISLDELRAEGYQGFYLAIGCQGGRLPNIPGENAENAHTAVDFLRENNAGNGEPIEGKVVVIGGGNVAIDSACVSAKLGADSVNMYCLECAEEMPASSEEILEARAMNVTINHEYGPKEILQEAGKVTGIVLKKCTSVFDANGHFNPQYDENDTITVPCEHVIFSIGQSIEYGDLLADTKVEFGRGNSPIADAITFQTAEPDIFVGGDLYTGPRFAIDAIAQGREGAESLHRFVHENASLTIGRNRREFIELDTDDVVLEGYDESSRQIEGFDSSIDLKSFTDRHLTLTEEQVKIETARCLDCGTAVVDYNKCIGCGLCTTKCNFDAIHLHRELPEMSNMVISENKMKHILPYALKRAVKTMFKKMPTSKVKYDDA